MSIIVRSNDGPVYRGTSAEAAARAAAEWMHARRKYSRPGAEVFRLNDLNSAGKLQLSDESVYPATPGPRHLRVEYLWITMASGTDRWDGWPIANRKMEGGIPGRAETEAEFRERVCAEWLEDIVDMSRGALTADITS